MRIAYMGVLFMHNRNLSYNPPSSPAYNTDPGRYDNRDRSLQATPKNGGCGSSAFPACGTTPPERELGPAVGALGTDDLDDLVAAEHGEDPAYARPVADDERLVVAGDLGERGGDGVFRVHRPFGIAFFEHGAADVAVLLVDVRPLPFLSFRRLEKGNRLRGREREWRVESRER